MRKKHHMRQDHQPWLPATDLLQGHASQVYNFDVNNKFVKIFGHSKKFDVKKGFDVKKDFSN